MTVPCATCGKPIDARHSKRKYCDDRCRKNKGKADVVELTPPADTTETPDAPPAKDREPGPVEAATAAELEEAGKLGSALGQACIVLARRLDLSTFENGGALSALTARLEATLATVTKGTGKRTAPQSLRDELAERRAAHGA